MLAIKHKLKQRLTPAWETLANIRGKINKKAIWDILDSNIELWRPKIIYVSTINYCNAHCIFCGQHRFSRPKGIMTEETWITLLRQCKDLGIQSLDFTPPLGEPLLDPYILDRAEQAKSLFDFKELYITTNGILINKVGVNRLSSLIKNISISMGGFFQDSYKEAYGVDKYREVLTGLQSLAFMIKDQPVSNRAKVKLLVRSIRKPAEELSSYEYQYLKRVLGDNLSIEFTNFYDNWGGSVKPEDLKGVMQMRAAKVKQGIPCRSLYQIWVEYNGNVRLCGCRFKDEENDDLVIGNLLITPLKDLLGSSKMKEVFHRFKKGANLPDVCKDCSLYRPIVSSKL